jgi:hypothetical protein
MGTALAVSGDRFIHQEMVNSRGTRLVPLRALGRPRRLLQDEDDRLELVAASASTAVSTRAAFIGASLESGTDVVADGVPTERGCKGASPPSAKSTPDPFFPSPRGRMTPADAPEWAHPALNTR